jgi:hypothetical protein
MNSHEAKRILLRYRPDASDAADPDVAEALALVGRDPELQQWFDTQCAFQRQMRQHLRNLPVPPRAIAPPKVLAGPASWWTRRGTLLAAAAAVVAAGIALSFWFTPKTPAHFDNYRARMARSVLREYQMDIETRDMNTLRQYLDGKGAPADYRVPDALQPMALTGGGVHRWRGKPVSMICFDQGKGDMIFLFVVDRSGIENPPPARPEIARVSSLVTASWTEGTKAYLLATEGTDESALRKYL